MKIIKKEEHSVLYDLGALQNGALTFSYAAKEGRGAECFYGPYPDFIIFRCKYDAEEREGRRICRSRKLVTARYLCVRTENFPAEEVQVQFESKMYPLHRTGTFSCENELYNRMFSVCEHTLHCCVFPHTQGNSTFDLQSEKSQNFALNWHGKQTDYVIVDGARRDREVWVGDLYPEIRNVWALFSDRAVIRNTFDVILDQIREDGFIPASSISMQVFYEYNCWFLLVLEDYLKVSGDIEYYRENADKAERILEYILGRLQDGFLDLGKMQTWAWTSSRCGKITSSHCVLYGALCATARMKRTLDGDEKAAARYERIARELRARINAGAYDAENCLYYDVVGERDRYSLDASGLAVLFGVCEEQNAKNVLHSMKAKFRTPYGSLLYYPKEIPDGQNFVHNDHVWPFVNTFELEALLQNGETEQAQELLETVWGGMLKNGAETFWEVIEGADGTFMRTRMNNPPDDRDTWNSECHGWSAGLPYLLYTYFAGVRPAAYGYAEVLFSPVPADLGQIDAKFTTRYGEIEAHIRKNEGSREAVLICPEQIKVHFGPQVRLLSRKSEEGKVTFVLHLFEQELFAPREEAEQQRSIV